MLSINRLSVFLLVVLLLLSFTNCSNESTGPDRDPPQVPDLQNNTQPDVSYFQNNSPDKLGQMADQILADSSNFVSAKQQLITASFLRIGQIYAGNLPGPNSDPTYKDGQWVWEYNSAGSGLSFGVRTTATYQENSTIKWVNSISLPEEYGGDSSYTTFMEGTTNTDLDEGTWNFLPSNFTGGEGSSMKLTSEWEIISEGEKNITLTARSNGNLQAEYTYEQDRPEHLLIGDFPNDQLDYEVFWNEDTGVGYTIDQDGKKCWNGSLENVSCSAVGL